LEPLREDFKKLKAYLDKMRAEPAPGPAQAETDQMSAETKSEPTATQMSLFS
jgi:hypothetical protein